VFIIDVVVDGGGIGVAVVDADVNVVVCLFVWDSPARDRACPVLSKRSGSFIRLHQYLKKRSAI